MTNLCFPNWQPILSGDIRVGWHGAYLNHAGIGFPEPIQTVIDTYSQRVLYQVGREYGVRAGKLNTSRGRILVDAIHHVDVRLLDDAIVAANQTTWLELMLRWTDIHDKPACRWLKAHLDASDEALVDYFSARPKEDYQSWQLHFHPVK